MAVPGRKKIMTIKSRFSHRTSVLGLVGGLFFALAGCETDATTSSGDSVRSSGFLSDYSMLRQGDEGEAISIYWNDQADFNSYSNMLIEPVTIWADPDSDLNQVPAEERQELANAFHAALQEALSEDFEIVQVPGPNTIRLRVALTEAVASNPALDTISTYVPTNIRLLCNSGVVINVQCNICVGVVDQLIGRPYTKLWSLSNLGIR